MLYLTLFLRYSAADPDEGIILQGAQRILQGQVPYRDFFSFYTPLSYYWFALLLRLFGNRIEVARASLAFFGAVFALFTYVVSRRVCSYRTALLTGTVVGVVTMPYRFLVLHNWDSTFWACLAIYAGLRLVESQNTRWAFLAGSLVAITGLSEQSKGVGLFLGLVAGYLLVAWLAPKGAAVVQDGLAFAAGGAWPTLVVLAYFARQGAVTAMLQGWFWPTRHYSAANHVLYGSQNWSDKTRALLFSSGTMLSRAIKLAAVTPCFLVPVLPILAGVLLVYWTWRGYVRDAEPRRMSYYLFLTSVILGMLVSVVMVRPDIVHFMYLLPLFAVVLAWFVDGRDIPGTLYPSIRPVFATVVIGGFALMSLGWPLVALKAATQEQVTRRGSITSLQEDEVVSFIQSHALPGERILVYPYLPLYYYLTGTRSPGAYEYLQPGMSTSEQVEGMLRDLKAHPVRVVLLEPSFADKIPTSWPGTPVANIWRDPVSDYVLRHYHLCRILRSASTASFFYMARQGESCPTD
ncbi:MAG: glycosyltransferase family 39 protein [Acidobacteriales bacterium]|nr:glycosyltransferase family 39 protein [Terriglobales bacterium]